MFWIEAFKECYMNTMRDGWGSIGHVWFLFLKTVFENTENIIWVFSEILFLFFELNVFHKKKKRKPNMFFLFSSFSLILKTKTVLKNCKQTCLRWRTM